MKFVLFFITFYSITFENADGLSNAGKKFLQTFHFNYPTVEPNVQHLFVIATEQATDCIVTVTVDEPLVTTHTITVNSAKAVVHPLTVASTRGIKLEAPCDFVVYGLNFATQSADGWMAIPEEALQDEYVILGVEPWLDDPVQLSIVAVDDNTTCTTTFTNGTVRTSNLNSMNVNYMTSDSDITGSRIKCNSKVSVFTGQRCSTVPKGCIACDHTVEQVPPKKTLGRNFAMVPLLHGCTKPPTCCSDPKYCSKCTEIYRVMAVEDDTTIIRTGTETNETFVLQAGQSSYILLSQTEYSHLVSSRPIMLAHYFQSQEYEQASQDPAFAIIPQIESFGSKYQAATCFPQFQKHFVNLVVPANSSTNLLLNGATFLPANGGISIPGTGLEAFRHQFDCSSASGGFGVSFKIEHTGNASFGMFAYGFSDWISYGYPGGMHLEEDPYYSCPLPNITVSQSNYSKSVCSDPSETDVVFPNGSLPDHSPENSECCGNGNGTLFHVDRNVTSTACIRHVERTWKYTDACGRTVQTVQNFFLNKTLDTYKPPPSNIRLKNCTEEARDLTLTGSPTIHTNYNTTLNISYVDETDNYTTHINRTWTIRQHCTNETITFNQTITCAVPKPKKPSKCECACKNKHHHHHRKQSPCERSRKRRQRRQKCTKDQSENSSDQSEE